MMALRRQSDGLVNEAGLNNRASVKINQLMKM